VKRGEALVLDPQQRSLLEGVLEAKTGAVSAFPARASSSAGGGSGGGGGGGGRGGGGVHNEQPVSSGGGPKP
jgi:hypothetical protein